MEVAHEDYGEMVPKLVSAVQNGKCDNWNQDPCRTANAAPLVKSEATESKDF